MYQKSEAEKELIHTHRRWYEAGGRECSEVTIGRGVWASTRSWGNHGADSPREPPDTACPANACFGLMKLISGFCPPEW